MSQPTPIREARLERHLMRQRGAGARTVTADFGFSIPPISFPIDSRSERVILEAVLEPIPKRKRTSAESTEESRKEIILGDVQLGTTNIAEEAELVVQPKKKRRKLAADVANERPKVTALVTSDDSFLSRLKPGIKRSQRVLEDVDLTSTNEPFGVSESVPADETSNRNLCQKATKRKRLQVDTEAEPVLRTNTQPEKRRAETWNDGLELPEDPPDNASAQINAPSPPKVRAQRSAARTAAVRVMQGFVEESIPVDKKRRDEQPQPASKKRSRKQGAPIPELEEELEEVPLELPTLTPNRESAEKRDHSPPQTQRRERKAPKRRPAKLIAVDKQKTEQVESLQVDQALPQDLARPAQIRKPRKKVANSLPNDNHAQGPESPAPKQSSGTGIISRKRKGASDKAKGPAQEAFSDAIELLGEREENDQNTGKTPGIKRRRLVAEAASAKEPTGIEKPAQRRPLGETDANTRRSCSPARLGKLPSKPARRTGIDQSEESRASNKPAEGVLEQQNDLVQPPFVEEQVTGTQTKPAPKKRRKLNFDADTTSGKQLDSARSNPPGIQSQTNCDPVDIKRSRKGTNEDVDWLFAAGSTKRASPKKPSRRPGKRKFKDIVKDWRDTDVDVDLDDLLVQVAALKGRVV